MIPNASRLTVLIAAAAIQGGCESKPYGLAPVAGAVTLDGKPVPGSVVTFQPQGGEGVSKDSPMPGSTGRCDDSGHYELKTIRGEVGAVAGPHTIRIHSPKAKVTGESDAPGAPKELFPPKYNFQTGLTFEVPPEGTDAANFELTSQ